MMANQYTGIRPATREDLLVLQIERLQRELEGMRRSQDHNTAILEAAYRESHDPVMAWLLVAQGVDVFGIDKELGRETLYKKRYEYARRYGWIAPWDLGQTAVKETK